MTGSYRVGIFPGSFNPFHKGHLDILMQAIEQFDKVIIAVGTNPDKKKGSINRVETIKLQLKDFYNLEGRVKVEEFSGFLVDYVHKKELVPHFTSVSIIRGLRNASDLEFETTQARVIQDQKPDVKTVFFLTNRGFEHVSSSMIRALEGIQEGSASEYIVKNATIK